MTKGIHRLTIKNFKAFPAEQHFDFEGKHVLIYGENGSGKSSIYWALYTLLQSSIKAKKTDKYFKVDGKESLLNINTDKDDGKIEMQLVDQVDEKTSFLLDKNGFQTTETAENRLGEMNLNSDFISYRLMMNIFNIKHSETVDLWNMFEKEVLPFLENDKQQNWNDLYNNIIKTRPYALRGGKLKDTDPNSKIFKDYQTNIEDFNTILTPKIKELTDKDAITGKNKITSIYENFFGQTEDKSYSFDIISLPLKFEKKTYQEERSGEKYEYEATKFWDIVPPQLLLKVEENNKSIEKPQSFFNEARLTRIALAIRLAILETRPKSFEHKILVLDDLLISLDMSNRELVLEMLLKRYQADYQLIILTHERSFFQLVKRKVEKEVLRINRNTNAKNKLEDIWKLYEIYEHFEEEKGYNIPKVFGYDNILRKAKRHFKNKDYPACANYLRSYLESWFQSFLPSNKQKDTSTKANYTMLNDLTEKAARPYFGEIGFDTKVLDDIIECKDVLLNPLSHSSSAYSEVYKVELEKVFEIVDKRLPQIKNDPIFEANQIIRLDIHTEEGTLFKLYWSISDDYRLFKDIDKTSWVDTNFKATFALNKSDIGGTINNSQKHTTKLITLEKHYDNCCASVAKDYSKTPIKETDMTTVFKTEDGKTIDDLIKNMY